MRIKPTLLYLFSALLFLPIVATLFASQPVFAYKCSGQTNNQQHYYREGACYQPVGNTCLDDPAPNNPEDCQNRDVSKDVKVTEKPVKNDGSDVTEWKCSAGTYNATKHTCETCNALGTCQPVSNVVPTPEGDDTTVDPDEEAEGDKNSEDSAGGGEGECAGEKTDFFACDADGADAIVGIIRIIILIVSVGVGIVAVGGIVYGAVLYASAQDSQDQIRKAIKTIRSVIIGVLLYVFMVTIINFLVPGGVFSGSEPEEQTNSAEENPATNEDENPDNTPAGNN